MSPELREEVQWKAPREVRRFRMPRGSAAALRPAHPQTAVAAVTAVTAAVAAAVAAAVVAALRQRITCWLSGRAEASPLPKTTSRWRHSEEQEQEQEEEAEPEGRFSAGLGAGRHCCQAWAGSTVPSTACQVRPSASGLLALTPLPCETRTRDDVSFWQQMF